MRLTRSLRCRRFRWDGRAWGRDDDLRKVGLSRPRDNAASGCAQTLVELRQQPTEMFRALGVEVLVYRLRNARSSLRWADPDEAAQLWIAARKQTTIARMQQG